MGTFRLDELTGAWVAVVPGRKAASRGGPRPAELPCPPGRCPFCPGHEADTEDEVAAIPGDGPWRVRVVRNLFPLVHAGTPGAAQLPTASPIQDGPRPPAGGARAPAWGEHEVLVETPEHDVDLPDLPATQLADVLRMYRDRVRALRAIEGVRAVAAFRNRGRRAGSSQPHPHGQLTAIRVPAAAVERRHELARAFAARRGRSLLEDLLEREVAHGERVVEETEHFVVLCPPAPHRNDQTWLVPRRSRGCLADLPDPLVAPAASVLRGMLRALREVSGGAAYNLVFRMPPATAPADEAAFWYIDVLPSRGGGAGFELATGIDVVTIPPERTAAALRASLDAAF